VLELVSTATSGTTSALSSTSGAIVLELVSTATSGTTSAVPALAAVGGAVPSLEGAKMSS
jgi:hypothetical protein